MIVRVSLDLSSLGYAARGIPLVVRRQLECGGLHGGLLDKQLLLHGECWAVDVSRYFFLEVEVEVEACGTNLHYEEALAQQH